jgi:acyl carrier protein
MDDLRERLIKCFSAVFPELTLEEILKASPNDTGAWDSLSLVTLLAVVGEEFGIDLDTTYWERGLSFEGTLAWIKETIGSSRSDATARVN